MNMIFGTLAMTALVLGVIGLITDSWDWIIPILTIAGIIWCFVDCVKEEKETAHR